MLVDAVIGDGANGDDAARLTAQVRRVEALGLDGAWASEIKHDPFLTCAIAAQHSERVTVGTSIAVAFARSPMTVANTAHDLQSLSSGRFALGLGSQIKPHIERRFSMPWSSPAARMREYIEAIKAIWTSWETGGKLDFRGDFYRHTLMTPMFDPGPNQYGRPPIYLAAVGEHMTRAAADAADGIIVHSFSTQRSLREITLPAVEEQLARRGISRAEFCVLGPMFVVTGSSEEQYAASDRSVRKQIAFYGSTPAYQPVLDLHGWTDLALDLNRLSKRGEWEQMADLIDDEVLAAFAVSGPPESVGRLVGERLKGLIDRVTVFLPEGLDNDVQARIVTDVRVAGSG